ncbi:MAG TPA: hypothetical protein VHB20_11650 [Verrucomicrobiae bacterium]|nr:hypothetical protein [Verrucomicrobiae bacterium]
MNAENAISQIENTVPVPAPAYRRPRGVGRVARLPLALRNLVNQSLRDGLRYSEIIAQLAARGRPGFKPWHITNWMRGGYRPWLALQERFEHAQAYSERTLALLGQMREDGHCDLAEVNDSLLAAQLHELLEAVQPSALKTFLAEKPEFYFQLAKALNTFGAVRAQKSRAQFERLRYELELRKMEQEKQRPAKSGISRETLRQIEEGIKMM